MLDWTLENLQKVDRVVLSPVHPSNWRFLDDERDSFFFVRMFVGEESLAHAIYPNVSEQESISSSSCLYLRELLQAITGHKFLMRRPGQRGWELWRSGELVIPPEPDGHLVPLTLENLQRVEEIRMNPYDLFGLFINTSDRIHRNECPEGRVSFCAEHLLCYNINPLESYLLRLIGAVQGSRFEIPPESDGYSSMRRPKRQTKE